MVTTAVAPALAQERSPKAEAMRILQKFEAEPSIVAVQQAASRYAQVNPEAYDSWLTAANLAYLLPRNLRGRVRSTNDDQRDVRTSSGAISDLVSIDEQAQYELTADWDLTRLVFNRDQITAARQIERIVNQREDVLTTVNKLYFARRQLQVEMELDAATSVDRAIKMQLRIDALTADLDALTGGWFSKQLARANR
jgi:hypothetical protein